MSSRRRVWIHRVATLICLVLAVPGVLWWKGSILFVILISLSTQAYTSWSAAEAADDRTLSDRLDRMQHQLDALLEQRRHPRD